MACSILLRLVADQNSWEEQWLLTNCHFFQSCISVVFYQTCEPYVILILGSFINCCAEKTRCNYELLPEIIWGLKTSEIEFRSDNLSFDQIVEYWELGCQFQEKCWKVFPTSIVIAIIILNGCESSSHGKSFQVFFFFNLDS